MGRGANLVAGSMLGSANPLPIILVLVKAPSSPLLLSSTTLPNSGHQDKRFPQTSTEFLIIHPDLSASSAQSDFFP